MPITKFNLVPSEDPSHLHRRNGQGYHSTFAACWIKVPLNFPGQPIRLYCVDCGYPLHVDNTADENGVCEECDWILGQLAAGKMDPDEDIPRSTLAFRTLDDDEDFEEPYMGYTPGEDRMPERGAFPGEMWRA